MSQANSVLLVLIATFVVSTCGQGATNPRSDRIAQAISASGDAINQAVEGRASVQSATSRGKDFAKLAGRESATYADFGRKLLTGVTNPRSDRTIQASIAASDAINQAVLGDRASVQSAALKGKAFANLAARESSHPSDFGRRLMTGVTNPRSDRTIQASIAASDAINQAVLGDRASVQSAALKGKAFANLAARESSQPSDFGRKLMTGVTNPRSDRTIQASIAASDAINQAVLGDRASVQSAALKGKAFANLAARESSHPSDFGRRLMTGVTNPRSDRTIQASIAASDAINQAVLGDKASVQSAALKGKAFANLAARESSHPSDFGRKLATTQ